jgi:hypothetical protein
MNWGKGIIGGMIMFMLFIIGMCIYMFMAPADDYDHQYYEKGLSFNHDYNREQQVSKDHAQPIIGQTGDHITFLFSEPVNGSVKFMRPSSTAMDKVFKLEGKQLTIATASIKSGQWQLVFDWTSNNKAYLYQHEIYVK